ncbi:MAG: DUF2891 domain-containing protein [Methylococcaceae bacterium]
MKKTLFRLLTFALFLFNSTLIFSQAMDNPFLTTTADGKLRMTVQGASHFAGLALSCIQQEYPNKFSHVLTGDTQSLIPHKLHPAFYGCYDWHSSVHGHWMLVRLLKDFPSLPQAAKIRKTLAENLSAENLRAEAAYSKTASRSWERMYGWAWLLKLAEELHTWDDRQGQQWSESLQSLTQEILRRYVEFLPIQNYPVRTGVHPNTAFALTFAWDFASTTKHAALKKLIAERSRKYFLADKDCPANWEPSGEDFLSPCMQEANLMRRVLSQLEFERWFADFLPDKRLKPLLMPVNVSDRSDPKIVHLDGLNLSRAWCLYGISQNISKHKRQQMYDAAEKHLWVTVPNVAANHYEGSHWLASFAVYALSENN